MSWISSLIPPSLADGLLSLAILLIFGLLIASKLLKKPMGEIINWIFSARLYNEPEIKTKPLEEVQQIWQQKRTIM